MPKRLLVLGGGTGGLLVAKEVRDVLGRSDVEITLIDAKRRTELRPSYLYVAFGHRRPEQISMPLELVERRGVRYVNAKVLNIDAANRRVKTTAGDFTYDALVVSLGAETIEGGFLHTWELDAAVKTAEALSHFRSGRLVIGAHSLPYRCPPAPFELAIMAHYYFATRGLRDKVDITVVHPWKKPFEPFGPVATRVMSKMMEEMGINFMGVGQNPAIKSVTHNAVETYSGETVKFDLAIITPPHKAPDPVLNSDLVKNGWAAPRNPANGDFRSEKFDDVYVIGDVAAPNVPVGMAGTILHSYAPHVVGNIVSDLNGVTLGKPNFRIVGTCMMDTGGFGMAAACDFTPFVKKQKPYPDCIFLPPAPALRIIKEVFEKLYFGWLLGKTP